MSFPTKVKKIKLRAADGTVTGPFPLTTDYQYIDVASQGELTTLDKALLDGAPADLDLTRTSLYELVITSNQQTKEEVNSALKTAKVEIELIKQEAVSSKTAAEAAQKAAEEAAASINTDLSSYWTSAEVQEYITETEENTTYTLEYEKGAGRLVLTPSTGAPQYIDVSDFIKDGMLQDVQYNPATHVLTLIWNTTIDEDNKIEINLSDLIDVVPTLISELENDVGYITIKALTDGGYLTKTAADDVYATQDALDITNSNITDAQNDINNLENRFNDLTAQGGEPNAINVIKVNGKAQSINIADNKSVNITVPVAVSELTNDAGFISSIPMEYITESELSKSLESYVTNSTLEGKNYATKATTLQGYGITNAYTKAEIDATISAQQQVIDNAVLINTEQSNDITAIEQEVWGVDTTGASRIDKLENAGYITSTALEGYAQVTDIPIKVSELENDANYITSIPDEYITEAELDPYATKTYVTNAINEAQLGGSGSDIDLSIYATEEWVKEQGYLTEEKAADTYATSTSIANTYLTKTNAANIYLTQDNAEDTYASLDLLSTYAQKTDVQIATTDAANAIKIANSATQTATAAQTQAANTDSRVTTLSARVDTLESQDPGEENVIEGIRVNNVSQVPDAEKQVNITIPTALGSLDNDMQFINSGSILHTSTLQPTEKAEVIFTNSGYSLQLVINSYTKSETYNKSETLAQIKEAVDQVTGGSNTADSVALDLSNFKKEIYSEIWGQEIVEGAAIATSRIDTAEQTISILQDEANNYLTQEDLEDYVTNSDLESKKYATQTYVDDAIAQAELGGSGTEVDLSEYAKISWVEEQNTALKTEIENKGYVTLSDTDGRYVQPADLDKYALDTDVTTVGEVASAAKSTADTAASNITTLTGRVEALENQDVGEDNLIEVVSVNGVNQPIVDKTVNITIPTKLSEFEEDLGVQELQQDVAQLQEDLEGIVSEGGEPNKINKIMVNGVEQAPNADKIVNITVPTKTSDLINDSNFITLEDVPEPSTPDLSGYYTKAEIDNMLANVQPAIETATDEDIDALFL